MLLSSRKGCITLSLLGMTLLLAFSNANSYGGARHSRSLQSTSNELCPQDYFLVESGDSVAPRRKLQKRSSPIEIVSQDHTSVKFTINSKTSFGHIDPRVPDHVFTTFEIGNFGSEQCYLSESMSTANSNRFVMKATCRPNRNQTHRVAIVKFYARYSNSKQNATTSTGMVTPKCCHDPYAKKISNFTTELSVYHLHCTAFCEDPKESAEESAAIISPSFAPSQYGPLPLVKVGVDPNQKLARCEGDCDKDSNCKDGLVCFQQDAGEALPIPGCTGTDSSDWDYCFKPPAGEPALVTLGADPSETLGLCEGDCDSDSNCEDGLVCFQRTGMERVPGCSGSGESGYDYCIQAPPTPAQYL